MVEQTVEVLKWKPTVDQYEVVFLLVCLDVGSMRIFIYVIY